MRYFFSFFVITLLVMSSCQSPNPQKEIKTVILAAEEAEYNRCREYFPDIECILMGVGAGNVIKTCCQLPEGTRVINIGYAGSNQLPIGTVVNVSKTYRLTDGTYQFKDHANPLELQTEGYPCYSNNSFVTQSDITDPVLFDMELNYIASFTPRLNLIASIKIVSDNLSVEAFKNNALRESGILTCDSVWEEVAKLVKKL